MSKLAFLTALEAVIKERLASPAPGRSYTARLAAEGRAKIAQKVGEEAIEVVLAAVTEDDGRVTAEAADLVYHLLVLLAVRGITLEAVVAELEARHADGARR